MTCTKCSGDGRVGLLGSKGLGLMTHVCPECKGSGKDLSVATAQQASGSWFADTGADADEEQGLHSRGLGVSEVLQSVAHTVGDAISGAHEDNSAVDASRGSGGRTAPVTTTEDSRSSHRRFWAPLTHALDNPSDNPSDSDQQQQQLLPQSKKDGTLKNRKGERGSASDRAATYVEEPAHIPPDSPLAKGCVCFLEYGAKPLMMLIKGYVWLYGKMYDVLKTLPWNVLEMIFGLALCFFGGEYFVSIAAVEAARGLGGKAIWENLSVVYAQGSLAVEASIEDDAVDADNDGTADVQDMTTNKLIQHKVTVCMAAVTEPDRLTLCAQGLFTAYLAILATLKFQFAKTVVLALAIADMLTFSCIRVFGPPLAYVMGPKLQHWVHPIICSSAKIIAVVVASYVQMIISAFYSGLRGGRMFALALFVELGNRGMLERLPDWLISKPFDADKSYLDEAVGHLLAACGFYFQFTTGFTLQFPLSLVFFPLTLVEWILRFGVYT